MGFGCNPETVAHVIEILDSVGEHLRNSMRESADLRAQLDREYRKKAIAGGYLRELLSGGTEAVHHTQAGKLDKFIGYETDWQAKRWTINTLHPGARPDDVRIELTRLDGDDLHVYELTVTKNAPVDIYPPKE